MSEETMRTIFAKNLRYYLEQSGKNQTDLCKYLNVSSATASDWCNARKMPRADKIQSIANWLGISIGSLMEGSKGSPNHSQKGVSINILGRVAAGIPIEAVENIIDTEEITEELAKTGKFFGLRIQGDSMEPDIHNGDIVIVRQQEDAESDEIVIALVNGNDGVCKRLKKYENSIALVSINANYEPMYFTNEQIADKPVRIIGKVVELRRKM